MDEKTFKEMLARMPSRRAEHSSPSLAAKSVRVKLEARPTRTRLTSRASSLTDMVRDGGIGEIRPRRAGPAS